MTAVEDVKSRLDIVEVVSDYMSLHKSGGYYKATCPFHTEKTPSFIVNSERQSWRCFGACATGGDLISFVMRMEKLDFAAALQHLAPKAGIELLKNRSKTNEYEDIFSINTEAAKFYRSILTTTQGRLALDYLGKRGVDSKIGEQFCLGLSPNAWDDLKSHLFGLGFSEETAVESGLLRKDQNGKVRDFFRNRLMFPIHDRRGRIIGFGGRSLSDSGPKYINTPATSIFDKRSTLYGLHHASDFIRQENNTGIIVEGYMDVIAAHQYGKKNTVASMGTALTEDQVHQLKKIANNFVLALDPDVAGQEATLRSLESSWKVIGNRSPIGSTRSVGTFYQKDPVTLRIAALPQDKDPDTLIREDVGEWERLISEAVPLVDYLITAIASRFDLSTGHGKAQASELLLPLVESADLFDQERYLRKLAQVLGVGVDTIRASIRPQKTSRKRRHESHSEFSKSTLIRNPNPERSLEDYTMALLLNNPQFKTRAKEFDVTCFHRTEQRELFSLWLECVTLDDLWEAADESLLDHLGYLVNIEMVELGGQSAKIALNQCLRRLEERHLKALQESLLAGDDDETPPSREIEREVSEVNFRIKELSSRDVIN